MDFTSMPNGDARNNEAIVLDEADDAIIADAISPLPRAIGRKGFSMEAWVARAIDVFGEPFEDDSPDAWVEFIDLFSSFFGENEPICHISSSSPRARWFRDHEGKLDRLCRPLRCRIDL